MPSEMEIQKLQCLDVGAPPSDDVHNMENNLNSCVLILQCWSKMKDDVALASFVRDSSPSTDRYKSLKRVCASSE